MTGVVKLKSNSHVTFAALKQYFLGSPSKSQAEKSILKKHVMVPLRRPIFFFVLVFSAAHLVSADSDLNQQLREILARHDFTGKVESRLPQRLERAH
jgi:hypothetical protein